jgi:hypothetical protein
MNQANIPSPAQPPTPNRFVALAADDHKRIEGMPDDNVSAKDNKDSPSLLTPTAEDIAMPPNDAQPDDV